MLVKFLEKSMTIVYQGLPDFLRKWLLTILCFKDTDICWHFPFEKNIWRSIEKRHKNRPGNLCSRVPIMHGIDSCSARSRSHLTIGNLMCMILEV